MSGRLQNSRRLNSAGSKVRRELALEELLSVGTEGAKAAIQSITEQPIAEDERAVVGNMTVLRSLETTRSQCRATIAQQSPYPVSLIPMTASCALGVSVQPNEVKPAIRRCGVRTKKVERRDSDQAMGEGFDFQRTGEPWLRGRLVARAIAAEQALEEHLHAAEFKEFCNSAIASTTASKGGGSPKIIVLMAR